MSDAKERSVKFSFAEPPHEAATDHRGEQTIEASAVDTVPKASASGDTASVSQEPAAAAGGAESLTQDEKLRESTPKLAEGSEDKQEQPAAPPSPAKGTKDEVVTGARRPKFVFCEECGRNIPINEWPDHRDRLRKVNLVEQVNAYQKMLIRLIGVFLMWVLRSVYFREVTIVGKENIPKAGAVVFYGNHQNQFVDALMMNSNVGREVRFIMAESSFKQRVMGFFGRIFNSVPVVRPQDVPLIDGSGNLMRMNGAIVTGKDSSFTTTLSKGDVIFWETSTGSKCRAQVSRIHSDTELETTIPVPPDFCITVPTPFKISRRIDHSVMYAQVYKTLYEGHCIGIFPEGGSHDHTSLLPLKAGVALFSLGAAERNIPVKVVPCGLTYLYGHKFRSRAYLEFGEPITPSDELVDLFGKDKREATTLFLDQLNQALRDVTINVPDWDTLKFLHTFRQLYTPLNCTLSAKDYLNVTRRLSMIINSEKDNSDIVDFRNKAAAYKDFCSALMIRDSQTATLKRLTNSQDETPQVRLLLRRMFTLFLMGVILVPFFVFGLPIGMFLDYYAAKKSKLALAKSKIKVVGADVKGSFKILTGFILFPVEIVVVTIVIAFLTDGRTALVIGFCLPMALYVSLLILQEAIMELRAALPLLMSLLSQHKQFKKLYEKRAALAQVATELVRKYDPELENEMEVYTHAAEADEELEREPSLFSLRYNVRRRLATNNA